MEKELILIGVEPFMLKRMSERRAYARLQAMGPQVLSRFEVKQPTLDECWTDYDMRTPQRTGW